MRRAFRLLYPRLGRRRSSSLTADGGVTGYAVYTPVGTEPALRRLLPPNFRLLLQGDGDLGARLLRATQELLALGHTGAILLNSDSPTLPAASCAPRWTPCGRPTRSC